MSKYYGREAIKLFAKMVSPAISKFSSPPAGDNYSAAGPVFIIGAPRTGSTILYQLLTNELNVTYIDNLVDIFYRNFFTAFKMSSRLFGSKPHNCFKSVHGNTWKCGLHAPSECGEFWYQWLPRERHYVTAKDVSKKVLENIRGNIIAPITHFGKPFVLKNLNAGLRLSLMHASIPEAKFIFVKRDPVDTAISILNGREKVHGTLDKWWSLIPPDYEDLLTLSPAQQVVNQIYRIEKQIVSDLTLFPEDHSIEVNYQDIMTSYKDMIEKMREFIGVDTQYRQGVENPNLREQKGSKHRLKSELEAIVKDFDWNNYSR